MDSLERGQDFLDARAPRMYPSWTPENPEPFPGPDVENAPLSVTGAVTLEDMTALDATIADASEWPHTEGTDEHDARVQRRQGHMRQMSESSRLVVIDARDFLAREIPPRETILAPWLLSQSLNMIHGWRGVGKTHMALEISYAVASGGTFLSWKAEKPHGVLYVDGEMPGSTLQARLAAITSRSDLEPAPEMLEIITPDMQPNYQPIPDLASHEGRKALDKAIKDSTKLIVIDNISSLMRGDGRENEPESWHQIQGWALQQRAQGRSVLFVHHSGKSGTQRGTSKREDVLDTVLSLRHPADYEPQQGACFEVHFEKSRNVLGDAAAPFEARLATDGHKGGMWTTSTLLESTFCRVVALSNDGLKQSEIADELSINRSTVSRHWRKAQEQGLLNAKG